MVVEEDLHRYRLPSASEWEYAARGGGEAVQPGIGRIGCVRKRQCGRRQRGTPVPGVGGLRL